MRRLLSVVHAPVYGGAHNQALRLTAPLRQRGYDTHLVLPDEPGDAAERLRKRGVPIHELELHRIRMTSDLRWHAETARRFRREVSALTELARSLDVDLIQVHGPVNPHGALAARHADLALIWQLIDTRAPPALRRAAGPVISRWADVVMSTGRRVAELHLDSRRLGNRLVPFVPPVDPEEFRTDQQRRARAREMLGVNQRHVVIGSIGNRNPQKGHEYVLRAGSAVRAVYPDVVVRIRGSVSAGHEEYERMLQRLITDEGYARGTLEALAPGHTVAEVMAGFDVFVLAAVPRSEGLPTVLLEAMAAGLPVISTDVGAVREIVRDDINGLVVPARDSERLADALAVLVASPERRERMGAIGRADVESRWSLETCVNAHVRAYGLALDVHARRRRSA